MRNQTWQTWELIIVDDGSQDSTAQIAHAFARKDARISVYAHATNLGAAAARNTALSRANGRYIAFLDCDDHWTHDKLERQLHHMELTGAALSYTGFWRSKSGRPKHQVEVPSHVTRTQLLKGNVIGCLTAMYDRNILGDCPMPLLRQRQDFALWLDILAKTDRAYGLTVPLATYNVMHGSLSSKRWHTLKSTWTMYRHHVGLSRPKTAWFLINHLLRRVLRG